MDLVEISDFNKLQVKNRTINLRPKVFIYFGCPFTKQERFLKWI